MSPLPLGFHRRLRDLGVVAPQAPVKVARESSGKPLRDGNGLAVMMADERDLAYRSELELYHQRVAVLAVAEALRDDPDVTFDAVPPERTAEKGISSAWLDYADAVYDELGQAGFTDGDLIRLCDEVCRLSNLLDRHLAAARQNFFPPPPANSA